MQSVLIIDDAEDVRSVIAKTLEYYGFYTRQAKDGMTGIQVALDWQPDLIICDVRMPGMDGYRTLEAIRELPLIATIPFIFLSAAVDKIDMRRGMVSGADDYLTKPFAPEELLEAVTARLSKQAELKCEIYKKAEKLREDIVHLFSQEFTGPLDGILGVTSNMMKDYAALPPERVFVNARQINESVVRLNRLARSLK
ncbi:MAG: response regulator receiver sensor signal transduction histidine kinase [Pedosphaera sp.]|nr:response regulator receiver sensor signal transduction histidine kinase [Pedosphaera sp.]